MDLPRSRSIRVVLAAYAVALLALGYHYPLFPSPNENARLYLLEALVHDGTPAIDGPLARHGEIEDRVVVDGRSYPNKPPGLAVLALPVYWLADRLAHAAGGELSPALALYLCRLAAVSLPAWLFAAALSRHLVRRDLPPELAAGLLAGLLFGTGLLPYAALLMAHATTAALLGGAALLVLGAPRLAARPAALTGLLLAGAAACDYPLAPPVAVLGLWALWRADGGRGRMALLLGAAAPAAVVLGYNAWLFSNPFDLGYGHYAGGDFARIHNRPLSGFGLPTAAAIGGLLVGGSKGLFAWSPLLFLAAPGAWRRRRPEAAAAPGRPDRLATLALLAASLALLLFIAAYPNWHGGWTTGPRYVVAAIPLLALLAAEALARPARVPAWLAGGLAATGIVLHALPLLTWPFLPELVANPIFDLSWPLLRDRHLATSASSLLGLGRVPGLVLVAAALAVSLAVALAPPRRAIGLALAALLVTLAAQRDRGRGEVLFCQAEVLYRMDVRDQSARTWERLLAERRPSPALAELAHRRLDDLYRRGARRP